jgi:hypothetical protein
VLRLTLSNRNRFDVRVESLLRSVRRVGGRRITFGEKALKIGSRRSKTLKLRLTDANVALLEERGSVYAYLTAVASSSGERRQAEESFTLLPPR